MTLHFGLKLDEKLYAPQQQDWVAGPAKLLDLLSKWLGLHENFQDNEYLRVESYRKAVETALAINQNLFFAASFQADPFSSAAELLRRRDELLLAGFDLDLCDSVVPARIAAICAIESEISKKSIALPRGEAEILIDIQQRLLDFSLPITKVVLYDKLENFTRYWQKIMLIFEQKGILFDTSLCSGVQSEQTIVGSKDLEVFQRMLRSQVSSTAKARVDGSLLLVRAKRETDLAEWLAKVLKDNTSFRPLCIIPETNRALDAAFVMEGLPAMGIASSSSARSILQLLKLATVFVWKPIDPFRIMEFLSLPVKPIDDRLAQLLSQVMSEKPGLYSQLWAARMHEFWEKSALRFANGREKEMAKIKEQYNFWFERRRYEQSSKVPKFEIIEIFEFLCTWAIEAYANRKSSSLLVLASQSEKIVELLKAIAEKELSYLELERIIRAIYKSSPVILEEKQVNSLDFVHKEGAILSGIDSLLWWNFTEHPQTPPIQFWQDEERNYLDNLDCHLENRMIWNDVLVQHRNRAISMAINQLLLLVPGSVQGTATSEHPLMGYLKAAFSNVEDLIFDLDDYDTKKARVDSFFALQDRKPVIFIEKRSVQPFIEIFGLAEKKSYRNYESPTSVEELLYFPYKWAFNYKARLNPGSILSVAKDSRLLGNLAHRVFEILLLEDYSGWTQQQLNQWLDTKVPDILFKEGATFLLYGREQEKSRLIFRIKYAAWSLISIINNNNWKVIATEEKIEGVVNGITVKAKFDLILARGKEKAIVDLKWSGWSRKREQLKNKEDLQLVLYAELYNEDTLPHTAFFILDKGKMLSRNREAFKEADIVHNDNISAEEIHREIIQKIITTYDWRRSQLEQGVIEIRTADNVRDLEEAYDQQQLNLMDMLEMKSENAAWDHYKVLIKGIK